MGALKCIYFSTHDLSPNHTVDGGMGALKCIYFSTHDLSLKHTVDEGMDARAYISLNMTVQ